MNRYDILTQVYSPEAKALLSELYGPDALQSQLARYRNALRYYDEEPCWDFCTDLEDIHIFRSPGRTEICGNHTDHQNGAVIAAAIDNDILAVAAPSENSVIRITSDGFGETTLQLSDDVAVPRPEEHGTTKALMRGIVSGLLQQGYIVSGFCAYLTSNVPEGAGMSSSAAFENMVGTMINGLFNNNSISTTEIAQISQFAEKYYYGKPCGLMDQLSSSCGGLLHLDFENPVSPAMQNLNTDLSEFGYKICLTDTHRSHGDLTEDYKAVPEEMLKVANVFEQETLRGITMENLLSGCREICDSCGDRAFLRALHFVNENQRVGEQADALKNGNFDEFLRLVRESGDSSYKYLQNVYSSRFPENQSLSVALAISETVLGNDGACRIHGGGFAGTIQAFVRDEKVEHYRKTMDAAFGQGSCNVVRICPYGSIMML